MNCSKCNKNMMDENGFEFIGLRMEVRYSDKSTVSEEFIQRQLGKYLIGKVHSFCWECWLDSIYGK